MRKSESKSKVKLLYRAGQLMVEGEGGRTRERVACDDHLGAD